MRIVYRQATKDQSLNHSAQMLPRSDEASEVLCYGHTRNPPRHGQTLVGAQLLKCLLPLAGFTWIRGLPIRSRSLTCGAAEIHVRERVLVLC